MRKMKLLAMALVASLMLALTTTASSPATALATAPPTEMHYGCVLDGSNLIRYVSTAACYSTQYETLITISPNDPTLACTIGPSSFQLVREVSSAASCSAPNTFLTLPNPTTPVYFCAEQNTGILRYVDDPNECNTIQNLHENPIVVSPVNRAPTNITLAGSSVAENKAAGTTVGTFSTVDPDTGEPHSYSLVAGSGSADNAAFQIVGSTLKTSVVFNYEAKSSYSIRVRSTDSGGLYYEKQFTISVINVNEAPTDITLSNSTVVEHQPSGTVVGTFSTVDPDTGDTFTYSLVSGTGSTNNSSFQIVGNQLRTRASFDVATKSSYSIRVRSKDAGNLTVEKQFTITVVRANQPPTNISLSNSSVAENAAVGTTVGTLSTTDPNSGDTFTYGLVPGTGSADNASFQISGNQLKTAASFDFESKASYSIRIQTNDGRGGLFEKQFTISITNVNEAPTNISLSNSSVAENTPAGTTVGTLSSSDPDAGNTFTYALVPGAGSDDNASFTITGATLKTAASFNFEAKSSYTIRVRSTDGGGLQVEKVLTINVTNVNEAPTNISLSNSSVDEDKPVGSTVGTFNTDDPDAGNTFTYALVSGAGSDDNASFTISGATLKTAAVFNYATKPSYTIRVRSTDGGGLATEKQFTITINHVNHTPTNITLSNNSVAENAPVATTVGTFSTSDPDASDSHSYSLVAGAGDDDNAAFTISGATLKTAASFDYEVKASYSIRVRTDDGHGSTFDKQFTISVTNVNEAPTDISLSNSSVAENAPAGTTVGNFSTTDPDSADSQTYTLVAGAGSDDNASFTIAGNALQTGAAFNFEAKSSYTIRVRSTDSGGLATEKQFTISVTDANEAPTNISLSDNDVDEGAPVGTIVGDFSTTDPDAGETFSYSLVAGAGDDDNASFQVASNHLETAAVFNYSTKSSYTIRVRSTDSGGLATEKQFTITVNQVNHAPTDINLSNTSVAENSPAGTTVGTFSSADADAADTHTYTLVAGAGDDDNASFTISGATLNTAASFNFEVKASYTVRVQTDDGNGGTFQKQFAISVTDVNEKPQAAALSRSVQANMKITLGGILAGASDPDGPASGNSGPFTLVAVTTDNCTGCNISNVNGAAGTFDFDPPAGGSGNYTLRYSVRDSGTPALTSDDATITIMVDGPVIWFVNPNAASNGDGRLSNPFNTLAAADAVDAANERIFLYTGTATTGISLNTGEWLVGQGVTGASFDTVFGINPPAGTIARPAVNGARPVVQGRVTMFASTVVRGLNIQPGSGVPGITGNNVNGVTIGEVSVTTVATQSVYFQNLFGVASVTDSSFTAGAGDNFRLDNSANTLDRLTLDNVTFGDNGVAGGSNLFILARLNAVVNVTVQNSTFTASRDTGLALNASEHSVVDVAFTGNTMRNTRSGILSGASNISLSLGGGTIGNPHNATVTYNIANNTFRDARGAAVATKNGGIGTGSMTGTITGNTIGVSGVARSGSFSGSGIVAELVGGGSYNATITNNTIYQFANYGILVQGGGTTAGGGQGYLTSTVQGNTVSQPFAGAGFPTNGLEIVAGTNGNDNTKFCLTLGGTAVADKNVLAGTGTNGGADLDLFQDFKTILGVPGYVGANNNDALMQTFLASRNVATTVAASNNTGSGGPGYSGTCP